MRKRVIKNCYKDNRNEENEKFLSFMKVYEKDNENKII